MALWQLNSATLPASIALIKPHDAVLLKRDAAYLLLSPLSLPTPLIYVLVDDAAARNVTPPSTVLPIDHNQWVELTLAHQQVIQCP